MENNKNHIALDVNEMLYFERGQEVGEMRSISLDPDVSLEVYETEVNIRGVVVLNGAYRKSSSESPQDEHDYPQEKMYRYIEKTVDKEEGKTEFYHRFPIDITIPNERVQHTEDIGVKITTFDYELPDNHTLKVNATLHITGLQEEVTQLKNVQSEAPEAKENDVTILEHDDHQEEEISQEEISQESKQDESTKDAPEPSVEKDETGEEEDDEVNQRAEKTAEEQAIDISLKKTKESDETDEVTDVQFLTDLFGNEEEEMHTTVTIYIAQEEDTVETIAKRFEMPTLQLVKDNHLSGEKIESGQLLYISRN